MNLRFQQPVSDLVGKRTSCRTFSGRDIDPSARAELERDAAALDRGLLGERVRFSILDKPMSSGAKFADYGLIAGARYFFVGAITRSERACESYGYLLEHLVLKAGDLGLDTCWVGYFHSAYFAEAPLRADEIRPSVAVVGPGADKRRMRDGIIRAAVRASSRKAWPALFFDSVFHEPLGRAEAGAHALPLDLVRLAPSSGNTQPWRIVKERGRPTFHFFMKKVKKAYALRGLHQVDMGIAMSHFALGCAQAGLAGRWVVSESAIARPDPEVEYRWTWLGE